MYCWMVAVHSIIVMTLAVNSLFHGCEKTGFTIWILLFEFDPGINNNSLVLKIIYNKFNILLTGDIEKETEESLAVYGGELKSVILKSPHHGSKTSSTKKFLRFF